MVGMVEPTLKGKEQASMKMEVKFLDQFLDCRRCAINENPHNNKQQLIHVLSLFQCLRLVAWTEHPPEAAKPHPTLAHLPLLL